MKFHVIVNPVAASGSALKKWQKCEGAFQQSGHDYQVHYSTTERGISDICRDLTSHLDEDINLVIIGGDGTMNDAVNGIVDFTHTRVGLIPCGSGNDMVRDMHIPKDVVSRILEGKVYHETDVWQTKYSSGITRKFLVSSGLGFDARICHDVSNSSLKPILNKIHLGSLVYVMVAFQAITDKERFTLTVEDEDGNTQTLEEVLFASMHNHGYEGGGFKFCPNANYSDGQIDVCIAHHAKLGGILKILPFAKSGNHVRFTQQIKTLRYQKLRLISDHDVWVHCDGETSVKDHDIEISVTGQKLKFLI